MSNSALGRKNDRARGTAAWHAPTALLSLLATLGFASPALAQRAPFENAFLPDSGKLPLTAGFNDIDGAGGGGLVPWAIITGYGTASSWGANAHFTAVSLRDFRLQSFGVAVGGLDRFELSMASDKFVATGPALDGVTVEQHIYGFKVRLAGDAVYGQDSWIPQTAVGLEYKRNSGISNAAGLTNPRQLGAASNTGTDFYVSATKIFLTQSFLLNATVRSTQADEFGLLGFGGDLKRHRAFEAEGTLAYLVARTVAVGAEYRGKPHNLSNDRERGAWDGFVAWTASRNVSLVAAYVRLGEILAPVTGQSRNQQGIYLSLQAGF